MVFYGPVNSSFTVNTELFPHQSRFLEIKNKKSNQIFHVAALDWFAFKYLWPYFFYFHSEFCHQFCATFTLWAFNLTIIPRIAHYAHWILCSFACFASIFPKFILEPFPSSFSHRTSKCLLINAKPTPTQIQIQIRGQRIGFLHFGSHNNQMNWIIQPI